MHHPSLPDPHWHERPDASFASVLGSLCLRVVPAGNGGGARFVILLPAEGLDRLVACGTEDDVGSAMRAAAQTARRLQQLVDGWLRGNGGSTPAPRRIRHPVGSKAGAQPGAAQ